MTKSLLQQVMVKQTKTESHIDTKSLIEAIEKGYLVGRDKKFVQKKTFAPSTIAYGFGECARYWYLAFDGNEFDDLTTPFSAANMGNGTLSHGRIQDAILNSGIAKVFTDEKTGKPTTEFKISNQDPPIFGYGDGILVINDEEVILEIKTCGEEAFQYYKRMNKAKKGHLIQILLYMKILKKKDGVLLYENKNSHELLAIPVSVNDHYRQWIDNTFNWLRTVRKAWEDRTLPNKNYRSNSKICKSCPVQRACADAGAGVIKIVPLEGLSEAV